MKTLALPCEEYVRHQHIRLGQGAFTMITPVLRYDAEKLMVRMFGLFSAYGLHGPWKEAILEAYLEEPLKAPDDLFSVQWNRWELTC